MAQSMRRSRRALDASRGDSGSQTIGNCSSEALKSVTFGNPAQSSCVDASGFSFFLIMQVPTEEQRSRMCGVEGCHRTIEAIKAVVKTDCAVASTSGKPIYLYQDILTPIDAVCGFDDLMTASSRNSTHSEGGHDGSGVEANTGSGGDKSNGLSVGLIVALLVGAIACGLLAALFTSRLKKRRAATADKQEPSRQDMVLGSIDELDAYTSQREYAEFGAMAMASKASSSMSRASTASSKRSSTSYRDTMSRASGSLGADSTSEKPWEHPAIEAVRIPVASLEFDALLSRGGFGEVYRGTYQRRTPVAIKKLLPDRRKVEKEVEQFLAEAKLMAVLHHERIVKLIGVAWDEKATDFSVVSEFADKGDLRSLLIQYHDERREMGFSRDKVKIALHVAEALCYLHSLDPVVLHRDLKSRNVLLKGDLDAVVTDFGVSRERSNVTMTAGVGTSLWMAPEVMLGERYDEKADVFSFGVLLSEIDTHQLPYAEATAPDVEGHRPPVVATLQKVALGKISVSFTEDGDPDMVALGQKCVALDPRERPTAADVLQRLDRVMRTYGAFV